MGEPKMTDRVALVTGAGSGIGKAIALALAREGAAVGALDVSRQRAEATAAEGGDAVLPLEADLTRPDQVEAAVARLGERFSRIDAVVANAGINGVWAPIEEMEPEEWDQVMAVNLRGTFLTFKYTVPWLRRQGGSAVIISSVQGTRLYSIPGSTAYACTKAAQLAFTRKAALELAPARIRVNAICPGQIETDIESSTFRRDLERITYRVTVSGLDRPIPLTAGQPHRPEDIARLAVFLLSDDAFPVTGSEVYADGASSLLVG
ncbi:MAG TPA: SDR family NAD(P)-dependent oxidoreductase [Candidatus Dormibacteraeota bacterium]|jgi:NAD(P)-dependent dehydrogenase (short-subunit alcohol dehydrogenase family)|nr:SDR family NAD(P)-dependent oxidoreductase [Candidatus Dormibacteraeota bacterium]